MMKSLTTALGALTILAVTGMATAPGQAMLGIRQTQTATPVSTIPDPGPAKVEAPAVAPAAKPAPATAAPHTAAPAQRPAAAAPAARPVATHPAAAPAPAASAPAAAPAANPIGNVGQIANILLNLPQVLQGTHVGPQGGIPPGQRKHNGDSNSAGDVEH